MQLGFVIDHAKCIGCHACTVACKAENSVPLGKFRTWVKYTEAGSLPGVRRSFAVLRCNQCTAAPCIAICPVRALHKRADGIVDIDPAACIGCKACLQGCPYDALYINDTTGTAEKCHFCAHRTERGLAPACAVVCPTEAIVPGDFHDPASAVSRLRAAGSLVVRKPEAGTGPNVLYRQVSAAGVDPEKTQAGSGFLWAERLPGLQLDSARLDAAYTEAEARARTTYDVEHPPAWGSRVSAYLFTKSIAAGTLPVLALLALGTGDRIGRPFAASLLGLGLVTLALTGLLLIADLKRPGRFFKILTRPNWRSWIARGTVVLLAYGLLLALAIGFEVDAAGRARGPRAAVLVAGSLLATLTAAYTGFLFAQAKGRVLWMRRGLWLHLIVQSIVAGASCALVIGAWLPLPDAARGLARTTLLAGLALHAAFLATEGRAAAAPRGRLAEYRRATRLLIHGALGRRRIALGIGIGIALPLLALLAGSGDRLLAAAAVAALVGLWVEEDTLVRAGQALAIS